MTNQQKYIKFVKLVIMNLRNFWQAKSLFHLLSFSIFPCCALIFWIFQIIYLIFYPFRYFSLVIKNLKYKFKSSVDIKTIFYHLRFFFTGIKSWSYRQMLTIFAVLCKCWWMIASYFCFSPELLESLKPYVTINII